MDQVISAQKKHLEQKKAALLKAETLLKVKERKARLRNLIEIGALVAKAKLDHLPKEALFGALLEIRSKLDQAPDTVFSWQEIGAQNLDFEPKLKVPIILQLAQKPTPEVKAIIRSFGLKWNQVRSEWYGYCDNLSSLKQQLANVDFSLTTVSIDDNK
jgi:hypothetical protein